MVINIWSQKSNENEHETNGLISHTTHGLTLNKIRRTWLNSLDVLKLFYVSVMSTVFLPLDALRFHELQGTCQLLFSLCGVHRELGYRASLFQRKQGKKVLNRCSVLSYADHSSSC